MSAQIVNILDGRLTVKFSGLVTYPEFFAVQQAAANFIRQHPDSGKVRILSILEDFRGWSREGDWGDTTIIDQYDANIERMAIVGDKRWEELALSFALKGLRPVTIEYFQPPDLDKAIAWLG